MVFLCIKTHIGYFVKYEPSNKVPIKLLLLFPIPSVIDLTSTIPIKSLFLSLVLYFFLISGPLWTPFPSSFLFFPFHCSSLPTFSSFSVLFYFFLIWSHQKIAHEKYSHLSTCCCKSNDFLSWVNYSCKRAKP